MSGLSIENVSKRFGDKQVLNKVTLEVPEKSFVTLLGPSGCGKTTLLRIIAGLERSSSGCIRLGSRMLFDAAAGLDRSPQERRIGYVFQDYGLWPHMTVFENVAFPLQMLKQVRSVIERRVNEVLAAVQLTEFSDTKPQDLSGGQRQRVSIARAIAAKPELLLFDEPLSNLDANLRDQVGIELRGLVDQFGLTCINVTHDRREAQILSDKIALIHQGSVHQYATPKALFQAPVDAWAAAFIDAGNVITDPMRLFEDQTFDTPICIPQDAMTLDPSGAYSAIVNSCIFVSGFYELNVRINGANLRLIAPQGVERGEQVNLHIEWNRVLSF